MLQVPGNLNNTKTHEWIRDEDGGELAIGVTADRRNHLKGALYIQKVAATGAACVKHHPIAIIMSSELEDDTVAVANAPTNGTISRINDAVLDSQSEEFDTFRHRPYDVWLFKITADDPSDEWINASAYGKNFFQGE
ncbi:hypothetical protein [Streptomyces sp. 1222.5]|uniref:hypothetical protein n=1 Tax=Streptomyces sp. 1222.5 TaxID=1881026 RepID=UPI003D70D9FE